jgi:hypothetical protein
MPRTIRQTAAPSADSLIGVLDATLAASGLYTPGWPVSRADVEDEVLALLIDRWGWRDGAQAYGRAARIAAMIARKRGLCT